jgi:hypothetical protein
MKPKEWLLPHRSCHAYLATPNFPALVSLGLLTTCRPTGVLWIRKPCILPPFVCATSDVFPLGFCTLNILENMATTNVFAGPGGTYTCSYAMPLILYVDLCRLNKILSSSPIKTHNKVPRLSEAHKMIEGIYRGLVKVSYLGADAGPGLASCVI